VILNFRRARTIALALGAVSALVVWLSAAPRAADSDGVKLESLKFSAFKARLAQAGSKNYKYTLVDAWATNCAPCKENFPHLIDLHKRFGGKGLQVVSLSLDDTSDAKAVEAAKEFLRSKKATFLNVLLDEDFGVGFEKLDINSIPAVFLFGPDGKEIKRFTMDDPNNQFTYPEVEKAVEALLDGKPIAAK
jgi:thiol-disulfide isomerase/thioredoxin